MDGPGELKSGEPLTKPGTTLDTLHWIVFCIYLHNNPRCADAHMGNVWRDRAKPWPPYLYLEAFQNPAAIL